MGSLSRSLHAAQRTASAPTVCARPGRRVISNQRHDESRFAFSASPLQHWLSMAHMLLLEP